MPKFSHPPVKLVHDQVIDGGTPVSEEACGRLRVLDDISHKSRHPRAEVVTCHPGEFLFHIRGPCLGLALPAVEQHTVQQAVELSIGQLPDVAGKMTVSTLRVELVAFETRSLGRGRSVFLSRVDVPDADDDPVTLRQRGFEVSRTVHFGRQVQDPVHPAAGILHDAVVVAQDAAQAPSRLGFPAILPGAGEQPEGGDAGICVGVGQREPVVPRGTDLPARQTERTVVLPVALRPVRIEHHLRRSVRIDSFQFAVYPGIVAEPVVGKLHAAEFGRPYRFVAFGHDIEYVWIAGIGNTKVPDQARLCPVLQFAGPFTQGSRKSQHHQVLVIAPVFSGTLRHGQSDLIACVGKGLGPHEVPHRLVGRYPRPACHSPSRTVLEGETQPQPVSLLSRINDKIFPFRTEAGDLFDTRPGTTAVAEEQLYPRESCIVNGFQVGVDAFLGEVAAQAVHPYFRIEHLRRVDEQGFIRFAEGALQQLVRWQEYIVLPAARTSRSHNDGADQHSAEE